MCRSPFPFFLYNQEFLFLVESSNTPREKPGLASSFSLASFLSPPAPVSPYDRRESAFGYSSPLVAFIFSCWSPVQSAIMLRGFSRFLRAVFFVCGPLPDISSLPPIGRYYELGHPSPPPLFTGALRQCVDPREVPKGEREQSGMMFKILRFLIRSTFSLLCDDLSLAVVVFAIDYHPEQVDVFRTF